MSTNAKPYKETLNLPVTAFDMKANLTVREPQIQLKWREGDLYAKIRAARAGAVRKVLHDGPPYANGEIHMGHLLNKVLKDIVVRSLTMRGFDSPYVPGWDCHGLPIEHKVMKDLGSKAQGLAATEIRARCHVEAMKWVDLQRDQFRRLGILGDWDRPYLTLDKSYESGILEVLADLLDGGYVFRQLKPIHWCPQDRTALAEAELEYRDHESPSIYVQFQLREDLPDSFEPGPWHAMIWTTTPWTLPANVAIAAHPRLAYCRVRYTDPDTGATVQTILARDLAARVLALRGVEHFEVLGEMPGNVLEGLTYNHPFLDRVGRFVLAEYVSADDGTGLVHTAPGHGTDDYNTGRVNGLPTISPVDASGRFDDTAPEWLAGKPVFASNVDVIARLRSSGHLFHHFSFHHSYPHCWRCKKPVLFRATEQWFIKIDHDGLRERTLDEINNHVGWHPSWGRSRIEAMVGQRPDWCISRQRAWGVPIPSLRCKNCEKSVLTAASVRHASRLVGEHGTDVWFRSNGDELAPAGMSCPGCGASKFDPEYDILDVWFESGSSWRGVLDARADELGGAPAYLYLEGSDQHRGWFQSSLLTSMGATGRAPFENVLTHGFIVDDQGMKMSKSGGNAISAVKAVEQYGADVLRLYVASLDYADDVRMSERGIKEAAEAYRKIRNTFRFLLGNLNDYRGFDVSDIEESELGQLDLAALAELSRLTLDVGRNYEEFEFYKVYQKLYEFCAVFLSSFYLDVLKDRLYAEEPGSTARRQAQYVLARIHRDLARLLAPIIPHTAEEVWSYLPPSLREAESVHLALFPESRAEPAQVSPQPKVAYHVFLQIREGILRELEKLRADKVIGSAQQARVEIGSLDVGYLALLKRSAAVLEEACIVSEVLVHDERPEGAVTVSGQPAEYWVRVGRSEYAKCERCWNHRKTVGADAEHPTLCERCARVIRALTTGA